MTESKRRPKRDNVRATISRCNACGSTDRTPYHNRTEQQHRGMYRGETVTHIIRRRTECAACGQARIDIHGENRAEPEKTTQSDAKRRRKRPPALKETKMSSENSNVVTKSKCPSLFR